MHITWRNVDKKKLTVAGCTVFLMPQYVYWQYSMSARSLQKQLKKKVDIELSFEYLWQSVGKVIKMGSLEL